MSTISLFQGLVDPELDRAIASLPVRRYPKGMVIFEQGERTEDVYCVVAGEVEIVIQNPDGDFVHVASLKEGSLFGEFSYLTGTPRSTAAVAKEETTLYELGSGWLKDLSTRQPRVQERLIDLYRSRVLSNVLRGSKLFSVLSPDQVQDVSSKMVLKKAPAGHELIREGASDLSLLVIKKGKVLITKKKGGGQITLGELGPGEVLGEMAIISGEPRSASAHAGSEVEFMELPGEDFKACLTRYPSLLKAIEDIVRSRAEQARRAVEQVIDEVVGEDWIETEDQGIVVESIKPAIQCLIAGKALPATLARVSLRSWTFDVRSGGDAPTQGAKMQLTLLKERIKEIDPEDVKDPLAAEATTVAGARVTSRNEVTEQNRSRLSKIVTALARARVRLFVYPEYDVSKMGVTLEVQTRSGNKAFAPVTALSQTNGRISSSDLWKPGEVAQITLHLKDKEILTTKALALEEKDASVEFQFEYETGAERNALEEFLRQVSKSQGYGTAASTAAPKKASWSAPVLTKTFKNPGEFLRTYMSSMESGLLKVPVKDKIPIGTQVNIHLLIGKEKGVRRIALSGLAREWAGGICEVELDELSADVREKTEQLCKRLVEERSEETWNKRKTQLVQSGVKVPEKEKVSTAQAMKIGGALLLILGSVLWALNSPAPAPQATQPAENTRNVEGPRDVIIKFQAKEGEIEVRSTEIASMRPDLSQGTIHVRAAAKEFTIPMSESEKLPPFMKRQLEKLIALQKSP
jgi:CRP-like cAMP-binding protein